MSIIGKVHSIESFGTVDGPGIRFVTFMQGCPLRCQYCHNPDTWDSNTGEEYTPQVLLEQTMRYKNYMRYSGGGVTVTGGEPLLQAQFVSEYLRLCQQNGLHTALDTSGFLFNDNVKEVLTHANLILLDIKNFDPKVYHSITGVSLEPTLLFLDYLREQAIPVIIRYVVVPDLTDNLSSIKLLSEHLNHFPNLVQIEVLPFHKMGEYKWQSLHRNYQLTNTLEPSETMMKEVRSIFEANGKIAF